MVLLGDFNTSPWRAQSQRIEEAGFANAFGKRGAGFGFTFPIFGRWRTRVVPSCVRIDHFWVRAPLVPRACTVGTDAGSDHRPLRAELVLEGAP